MPSAYLACSRQDIYGALHSLTKARSFLSEGDLNSNFVPFLEGTSAVSLVLERWP